MEKPYRAPYLGTPAGRVCIPHRETTHTAGFQPKALGAGLPAAEDHLGRRVRTLVCPAGQACHPVLQEPVWPAGVGQGGFLAWLWAAHRMGAGDSPTTMMLNSKPCFMAFLRICSRMESIPT